MSLARKLRRIGQAARRRSSAERAEERRLSAEWIVRMFRDVLDARRADELAPSLVLTDEEAVALLRLVAEGYVQGDHFRDLPS